MRGSDPAPGPGPSETDLPAEFSGKLSSHGISRRRFLHYCAGLTAVLALPPRMTRRWHTGWRPQQWLAGRE